MDFLTKRKLLYGSKDKSVLSKTADELLEAGYIDDALDFYEKAENETGFKKIQEIALKEGNFYLYKKICKLAKTDMQKATLGEIGNKAMELGKYSMALSAFKEAGNDAMRKKLEGIINPEKVETEESES